MAKFIMTVGDKTLQLLDAEAEKRNVSVQELLRAVIVPEWVRSNLGTSVAQTAKGEVDSQIMSPSVYRMQREPVLQPSIDRSKRQLANYLWYSTVKPE